MHCHKTGLCAQCAHPETRSLAHCARSAQVVGAAARTADRSRACHAHSQHRSCACWPCAGRDTPRKPTPGRDLKTPGRNTKLTQPLLRPGRDAKSRWRPSWRLPDAATSISCRDLVTAHSGIFNSRHQNPCSDLPHCLPCRDLKNDVATSNRLSPNSAMSRRHFFHVATSLTATYVATLKLMSRPQAALKASNPVATSKF